MKKRNEAGVVVREPNTPAGRIMLRSHWPDGRPPGGFGENYDADVERIRKIEDEAPAHVEPAPVIRQLAAALEVTAEFAHNKEYWADANRTHDREWADCRDEQCAEYRELLAEAAPWRFR